MYFSWVLSIGQVSGPKFSKCLYFCLTLGGFDVVSATLFSSFSMRRVQREGVSDVGAKVSQTPLLSSFLAVEL